MRVVEGRASGINCGVVSWLLFLLHQSVSSVMVSRVLVGECGIDYSVAATISASVDMQPQRWSGIDIMAPLLPPPLRQLLPLWMTCRIPSPPDSPLQLPPPPFL